MRSRLRLLLLFQGMWEQECVDALRGSHDVVLEREGFDSMQWRVAWRMPFFDGAAWLDRMTSTYRGRVDAVWSNDDQCGALFAAVLARRLGLPGAAPEAIVRAQHKLLLRQALAAAVPDVNVAAASLPADSRARLRDERWLAARVAEQGLRWPLFCKPVKASFSVMAARVDDAGALARHLALPRLDRWLLRVQGRPFEQVARTLLPLPCRPTDVLLEQPLRGRQVNVDGYAVRGDVRVLGLLDECMYPGETNGARHFAGFTMPSRLPADVQQRARDAAIAAVRAVGYDHGLFNVELFALDDGSVRVIEVNPRSAAQFTSLYRAVHGVDVETLAIRLAAGLDVDDLPRVAPRAGAAASFVFRRFDGTAGPEPSDAARSWLAATHPDARLFTETSSRAQLRREYRWLGSHRYAVLNHAAADFTTLFADGAECARRLFGVDLPRGLEHGGA
jgi:hypothetical protein